MDIYKDTPNFESLEELLESDLGIKFRKAVAHYISNNLAAYSGDLSSVNFLLYNDCSGSAFQKSSEGNMVSRLLLKDNYTLEYNCASISHDNN